MKNNKNSEYFGVYSNEENCRTMMVRLKERWFFVQCIVYNYNVFQVSELVSGDGWRSLQQGGLFQHEHHVTFILGTAGARSYAHRPVTFLQLLSKCT